VLATTFNPQLANVAFSSTAPNTNPDIQFDFNIPAPSANFSTQPGHLVTFGDQNVLVANAASVPGVGAYMGSLNAVWQMGLANEGCNSLVPVTFDLVDAGVDGGGTASAAARPFTNAGGMVVGGAGIPGGATGALTDFTYVHPLDPLGLKQGTDSPGLGTAPEGTIAAGVNEIRVDNEEMLVVGVDTPTKQYRVVRGWNGTATAAHAVGAAVLRVPVIYPNGPNTNLLANLAEDDGDLDNNGVAEEAPGPAGGAQFNADQIADGADALPSFVRNAFDPDANPQNGGYVQPRARYFGVAFVANSLIMVYQIVTADPGALASFPDMAWMTTAWGYPSLTFLQDPTGPASNSAVSDFCNFTSTTLLRGITHDNACTTAGVPPPACAQVGAGFTLRKASDSGCPGATVPNECGTARLTNPAQTAFCGGQLPGWTSCTIRYAQYAVSQRDWDSDAYLPELGDGHQNALDVCFGQVNPGWDPRANNVVSGQDADGDGLPAPCDPNDNQVNFDQDGDGWQNRIDNCPLIANAAADGGGGISPNTFQVDQDIAPPATPRDSGPRRDDIGAACDPNPTDVNGHYHATMLVRKICIGLATADCSLAMDNDADGIVNALDNCLNVPNGPGKWGPAAGFAQSQRDFNANGTVGVVDDITLITSKVGLVGGLPGSTPGYDARVDLDYDDAIDVADYSLIIDGFGQTC
jgi:hypothetical protein